MTVVAGLVADNKVYMGADSLSVSDDGSACIDKSPKVFRVGDYLFGCAGSPRLKQLLYYAYVPTKTTMDGEHAPMCYLISKFMRDLQDFFGKHGFLEEFKETETQILLGIGGKLFCIYSDFYLEESGYGYYAIGCAAGLALGSLYSTAGAPMSAKDRVHLALEASEKHNTHVRRPFIFEEV
jgi:hypothetical protein